MLSSLAICPATLRTHPVNAIGKHCWFFVCHSSKPQIPKNLILMSSSAINPPYFVCLLPRLQPPHKHPPPLPLRDHEADTYQAQMQMNPYHFTFLQSPPMRKVKIPSHILISRQLEHTISLVPKAQKRHAISTASWRIQEQVLVIRSLLPPMAEPTARKPPPPSPTPSTMELRHPHHFPPLLSSPGAPEGRSTTTLSKPTHTICHLQVTARHHHQPR